MTTRQDNIVAVHKSPVISIPLRTVADQYLSGLERKQMSAFTLRHEREGINSILKHLPKDVAVAEITTEYLAKRVFEEMRARGLKSSTINGRIKIIGRVLNYATEEGLVGFNAAYRLQKLIETNLAIPSFEEEQYMKILKQCNTDTFAGLRDKTIMALLLDNGIRLCELIGLNVDQVDLHAKLLKTVGGKTNSEDDLPLGESMVHLLAMYIKERGRYPTVSPALFVTLRGNRLNRSTIQHAISDYGRQAGITNVRVSAHTFRHTFARRWILNGGDPFTLRRILRHKTMEMINKYIRLWGHEAAERREPFPPVAGRNPL